MLYESRVCLKLRKPTAVALKITKKHDYVILGFKMSTEEHNQNL